MRLIQYTPKRFEDSLKGRKPVLQSIVPLNRFNNRDWGSLSDDELSAHGVWKLSSERIGGRSELELADSGLYRALRRRKLLDEVGLIDSNARHRNWVGWGKDKLIAHARQFIAEMGIGGRMELAREDLGLYQALRRRKLLDKVGIPNTQKDFRDWSGTGKDTIIAHAKAFIAEKEITMRIELKRVDYGLYKVLKRRELLDEVGLIDSNAGRRDWVGMDKLELADYAKKKIVERGITGRRELQKADLGLYRALGSRKLMDEVGLRNSNEKNRDWAGIGKDKLIAHAKAFIAGRGIQGREELKKADLGLYRALGSRKLLDEVGLGERYRDWAGMGDAELVEYAREFIAENVVAGRSELEKADSGLYQVLRRRELLGEVFSQIESSGHMESVNGVLGALESFGDEK
ncbi:MAG: hypothetical protein V1861_06470 [Candidatus Micrarchaeota archaeon]